MPPDPSTAMTPRQLLDTAVDADGRGNAALAEQLGQQLLESGHATAECLYMLAVIASDARQDWRAVDLLAAALRLDPGAAPLRDALAQAKGYAASAPARLGGYLLIKAWGYGFCSDLDHVLGCLLAADLSGRTPIVHWGKSSLFRDEGVDNAWDTLFDPVSTATIADVAGRSLFPPKWTHANLHDAGVNKLEGEWSRVPGLALLGADAEVAVSDCHFGVVDLLPWIRPGHRFHGLPLARIYRLLVDEHIHIRPSILAEAHAYADRHLAGRPTLAVHARGSDKPLEFPQTARQNDDLLDAAAAFIAARPDGVVFLLTDDESLRAAYASRLGERLVVADAIRSTGGQGVHYLEHASRSRLAVELLRDMTIATRCERFTGLGASNVACMIRHLRDWPEGTVTLAPPILHDARNPILHRR